jgi:hypothetical protein
MQYKTASNCILRIFQEEMQDLLYKKRLLTAVPVYEPVKKSDCYGLYIGNGLNVRSHSVLSVFPSTPVYHS